MGMNQDLDHLKLLSIFHYVVGGLTALAACLPLIHVFLGLIFILAPETFDNGRSPQFPADLLGWMFVVMGGTFVIAGWMLALVIVLGGRSLARHRNHTFCLVVAALSCLFVPMGTVLGVFTMIVLLRPSVKQIFSADT